MRDHGGGVKGFHRYSKAYYRTRDGRVLDAFNVGIYHPEGGTSGEFEFKWTMLSGEWACRLSSFDDGWSALSQMPELIKKMGAIDGQNIQPDAFEEMLISIGLKDLTEKEAPKR